MLNVLYDKFPDSVQADGRSYPVKTDFRVWLKLADTFSDKNLPPEQAGSAFLSVFRSPVRQVSEPLLDAVFGFLKADALYWQKMLPKKYPPRGLLRPSSTGSLTPVFCWAIFCISIKSTC